MRSIREDCPNNASIRGVRPQRNRGGIGARFSARMMPSDRQTVLNTRVGRTLIQRVVGLCTQTLPRLPRATWTSRYSMKRPRTQRTLLRGHR
jgi:hypothetical protein